MGAKKKTSVGRAIVFNSSPRVGMRDGGGVNRETRKGWPLLIVETEANGDLSSTNEGGPSLVGSLGSYCTYSTRDLFPASAALVGPVHNHFVPQRILQFMCPIAQQPGQAVVQGRLSLNGCLRSEN